MGAVLPRKPEPAARKSTALPAYNHHTVTVDLLYPVYCQLVLRCGLRALGGESVSRIEVRDLSGLQSSPAVGLGLDTCQ